MFFKIHGRFQLQFHLIGCCRLQNRCYLHYHAADSVLTSECSFNSPQIWNNIFIVLTVLGRCIMIETLSARKRSMCIYISGRQIWPIGTLSTMIPTGWRRWCSRCRRHEFWCWLFAFDLRRCRRCFEPPACPWILRCVILARKAAVSMIFIIHCRVSFYRSCHLSMPRIFNIPLLLFSDFCARFLDQLLGFLHRSARKPSFGHFCHI